MPSTGTPACPYGAEPIPGELHKLEWVGLTAIPSAILGAIEGPMGWVASAVGSQLLNVDDLCAANPPTPEAFSDDDWATKLADVASTGGFPNPLFMLKLGEWIRYGAFLNFCQCLANPGLADPGAPATFPICTTGVQSTHETAVMDSGVRLTDLIPVSSAVDSSGRATAAMTWNNAVPPTGGHLSMWIRWFDASLADKTLYPAFPGTILLDGSNSCFLVSFSVPTGATQFAVEMSSTGVLGHACIDSFQSWWGPGAACPVTPPTPTAPPVTVPTPPAPACDSATLCGVIWTINNSNVNNAQLINNTSETTTSIVIGSSPVSAGPLVYVLGPSHVVSGMGTVALSDGALGVLADLASPAAGAGEIVTTPPFLFEQGTLSFRNGDGWGVSSRLEHDPQIVMSDVTTPTTVGYDTQMSGSITLTELVIPPPA